MTNGTQLLAEFSGEAKIIDTVLRAPRWDARRQRQYHHLVETITAATGDPRPGPTAVPR
jgi:hypothetical protein